MKRTVAGSARHHRRGADRKRRLRRISFALLGCVAAASLWAGAAGAHIQIRPSEAAPGDSTLFTVVVPNELNTATVEIDLKVPAGVVPFSFQETPGWARSERRKKDKSLDVVTWKGSLPPDDFVEFSFLATTPNSEGTITWPAVQTYADGKKVRWIGPTDSEEPAPVTQVSKDVPPQNAGGEGAEAGGDATPTVTGQAIAAQTASGTSSSSSDTLAIVGIALGGLALMTAVAAIVLGRRRAA